MKSWNPIWCAASGAVPVRATIELADDERREDGQRPHREVDADPQQPRHPPPARRQRPAAQGQPRKATPIPAWASTVPHAEPRRPQWKP